MRPPRSRGGESQQAEVRAYALLLRIGTWASVAVLVLTFMLYVGGFVAPVVPIDRLPDFWGLRASEYLRQADLPRGWGWVGFVGSGDFSNYVGIVMLAGLTIVCYLAILPFYLRKRDILYMLIVLAEIAVLLLAASGY